MPVEYLTRPSGNAGRRALLGGAFDVARHGRRTDHGLDAAEIGRKVRELELGQEDLDGVEAAADAEAQHAAEAAHLPRGNVVVRVGGKSGVIDVLDRRMPGQPSGDREGALVLARDAQAQGLHSAQQTVGIPGRERRAVDLTEVVEPLHQFAAPAGGAAERIGVAAEKFGRAVQYDVRAQAQRILIDRRGKRVVHRDQRAARVSRAPRAGRCP